MCCAQNVEVQIYLFWQILRTCAGLCIHTLLCHPCKYDFGFPFIVVGLWPFHSFCAALKYFFLCYSSFLMLCFILLILTLESPILNLPPLYCIIDYYLRIMCVTNLEFAWHAHNFLNLTYSTVYTICILYLQRSVLNNDNTWVTQTIGFFHRRHFNMNL